MKIIKFEAENVKRLKAVEITPDGAVVLIGGKNGQGKSSILDSIMVAVGGVKYKDIKMVRDGKKKGYVDLDLGQIKVRRTFTAAGGGLLTVTGADGVKMSSPQAVLDSLIGAVSFDPLSFSKGSDTEQAEIIKQLAGLDLSDIEVSRLESYNERTLVNRETKRFQDALEKLIFHEEEKYQEEIDTKVVLKQIRETAEIELRVSNRNKTIADSTIQNKKNVERRDAITIEIKDLEDKILSLRRETTDLEKAHTDTLNLMEECKKTNAEDVGKLSGKSKEDLDNELKTADEHNQIFRNNQGYLKAKQDIVKSEQEAQELTQKILECDKKKEEAIQKAQMPIGGLSFDSDGLLTYQNIPFSQASQAEKIRVSVAIGMAMNPKLKVLLIKEGSLLDEDNLRMIGKMAQVTDSQVWVETVGTRDGCSVIMEDGVSKDPDVQSI